MVLANMFLVGLGVESIFFIIAAQDVNLMRTKPDSEQLPCPEQTVEFKCQIMVPSASLIWTDMDNDMSIEDEDAK